MKKTHSHSRRTFLKATAATMALGGCGLQLHPDPLSKVTDALRKKRRAGNSVVALVPSESYEEDIFKLLKPHLLDLSLPDFAGKTVVLKPNMVEWRPTAVTTHPAVILAAVQLADYLGAKDIIVAEGPGHFRDMEYLLEATGIGKACSQAGVRFVDLNYDDLEKVENTDGLADTKHYYLPRTVMEAGALISLPKLKTHHWVGVTCSMKNLFGTVPGRKYGWPKNILHHWGITESIIDLQHLIKPSLALVDAIIAMEGDGPINGMAKQAGFLALGNDLAAVDATCIRTMGINPEELDYIKIAGETIGNITNDQIKVIGSSIEQLQQQYALPITFKNHDLMKQATQSGS